MTARAGMANLILTLRGMCNAGTADVTIGTVAYWNDNHLQDVLDLHRLDIYGEPLAIIETYSGGGTIEYKTYQSQYQNFEETTGGTAIFYLEESDGDDIGTALYTVDYQRGMITFAADTSGTAYYLTGRSFDMNAAAADVWRRKAAQVAGSFSFSTDNHRVDKGALIKNAMSMADYYSRLAMPVTSVVYRGDVNDLALKR